MIHDCIKIVKNGSVKRTPFSDNHVLTCYVCSDSRKYSNVLWNGITFLQALVDQMTRKILKIIFYNLLVRLPVTKLGTTHFDANETIRSNSDVSSLLCSMHRNIWKYAEKLLSKYLKNTGHTLYFIGTRNFNEAAREETEWHSGTRACVVVECLSWKKTMRNTEYMHIGDTRTCRVRIHVAVHYSERE